MTTVASLTDAICTKHEHQQEHQPRTARATAKTDKVKYLALTFSFSVFSPSRLSFDWEHLKQRFAP